MVNAADHLLPFAAVVLAWFASTALIVWLANRRGSTRTALVAGAGIGMGGVVTIVATNGDTSAAAAYASFLGALAVWGWQELAFLTGAVAGSRRAAAEPGARGWKRFQAAAAVVIHHELALAATAVLLVALSWGGANVTGAAVFALLLGLRLSAKLNIFHGVPNLDDRMLPARLAYLKTYFGPRRFTAPLAASIAVTLALAAWLGERALTAPTGGAAVAASLLFALAALGALEHLFLALPVRDGTLWRWAMPAAPEQV